MEEDKAHELYSKFASIDATARQKRVRRCSDFYLLSSLLCSEECRMMGCLEVILSFIGRGWASIAAATWLHSLPASQNVPPQDSDRTAGPLSLRWPGSCKAGMMSAAEMMAGGQAVAAAEGMRMTDNMPGPVIASMIGMTGIDTSAAAEMTGPNTLAGRDHAPGRTLAGIRAKKEAIGARTGAAMRKIDRRMSTGAAAAVADADMEMTRVAGRAAENDTEASRLPQYQGSGTLTN